MQWTNYFLVLSVEALQQTQNLLSTKTHFGLGKETPLFRAKFAIGAHQSLVNLASECSFESAKLLKMPKQLGTNAPMKPLFQHQLDDIEFCLNNPCVYNASDPGTGKTRTTLEVIKQRGQGRTLVFAPKSIVKAAWGNDLTTWTPELTWGISSATDRTSAFKSNADVVVTNHDAVKWLANNPQLLKDFETLVIDESTAFKNHTAQRSKAAVAISEHFNYRINLSGTPMPNGPLDLWNQMLILDGGRRLGTSYFRFRNATCDAVGYGNFTKWEPKDGILDAVYGLINDITIRHRLEDCIDMPENAVQTVGFELPSTLMRHYEEMRQTATLETHDVRGINAAAKLMKLLQIASGAVYTSEGESVSLASERYELILDLVEQRSHPCLVAFNWQHQRDALLEYAAKRGLTHAYIDGSVSAEQRYRIVGEFQAGNIRMLLAHPASAGHGLTLTRGTTTIWASPTYNLEHFEQFNRRIYRAGQTQRTETLLICAQSTVEENTYAVLQNKHSRQADLLNLFLSAA